MRKSFLFFRQGRLWHKVAAVTALPLVLELIFLPILAAIMYGLQEQIEQQSCIESVSESVRSIAIDISDYSSALSGYALIKEPIYRERAAEIERNIAKKKEALSLNRKLDTISSIKVHQLIAKVEQADRLLSQIMLTVDGTDDSSTLSRNGLFKQIKAVQSSILAEMSAIMEEEQQSLEKLSESSRILRRKLLIVLVSGLVLQFIIAIWFVYGFSRRLASTFDDLVANAGNLAMQKPLQYRVKGTDEIAELDSILHSVSDILMVAKRKERAMVDNAIDLICSLSDDGRIIDISASCQSILGYEASELLGLRISELVKSNQESVRCALTEAKMRSQPFSLESQLSAKNGKLIDLQWSGSYAPEQRLTICVLHDITARKQLEQAKQNFLAMITHDMRSPLSAALSGVELIETEKLGSQPDRVKPVLRIVGRTLTKLLYLINDLLDVDKLESGSFELRKQNTTFAQLAFPTIDTLQVLADNRQVTILLSGSDVPVFCDIERTQRVLENLLSNAIKYSPERSSIEITAIALNGSVKVEVHDFGRGVPEEKQQLVFERFKQVDRDDELMHRGYGLGLAICKALVEAHDGKIGVYNRMREGLPVGSTFWFTLPLPDVSKTEFILAQSTEQVDDSKRQSAQ